MKISPNSMRATAMITKGIDLVLEMGASPRSFMITSYFGFLLVEKVRSVEPLEGLPCLVWPFHTGLLGHDFNTKTAELQRRTNIA